MRYRYRDRAGGPEGPGQPRMSGLPFAARLRQDRPRAAVMPIWSLFVQAVAGDADGGPWSSYRPLFDNE